MNELVFCSNSLCNFCKCCVVKRKKIEDCFGENVDIAKLQNLNLFFFLDMKILFLQEIVAKETFSNGDPFHLQLFQNICFLIERLLKLLQDFWRNHLEIFLYDQFFFEKIDFLYKYRCFSARHFQRFFTQWRSFACDNEIVSYSTDGNVIISWQKKTSKRKSVTEDQIQSDWIRKIDEAIAKYNREI